MSTRGIVGCLVFAAGLGALGFGVSNGPTQADGANPGRIIGTIVDRRTGQPIIAEVALTTLNGERVVLNHARASRQGEFAFDGLQPGTIHLVTKAEGYGVEHRGLLLNQGEILRADFQLESIKRLRGTVRDPNGNLLSGATVRVAYSTAIPTAGAAISTYQWETGNSQTGPQGTFLLDVHPTKDFIVEATHPEFVGATSQPVTNSNEPGDIVVPLSLRRGIRLTGQVKNEAGTPISGVQVRLLSVVARGPTPRFRSIENISRKTRYSKSETDGAFSFEHVTSGRKMLVVVHPGYRPFKQDFNLSAGQTSFRSPVVLTAIQ